MNKNIVSLVVLFFLMSCSSSNYNSTKSLLEFNQEEFKNWLSHNPNTQFYEKNKQLESFLVEDYLFKNKMLLEPIKLAKISYLINARKYFKSADLIKTSIRNSIQVSQEEINEHLQPFIDKENKKKDKVRIYQIYKNYPLNSTSSEKQNTLEFLNEIKSKINNLNDFKKYASQVSDSQSRLQNGLIGNISHGTFPDTLNDIVMEMKKNDMTDVLPGPKGAVIFYCEKIIPAKKRSIVQIKNQIKNMLTNFKSQNEFNKTAIETLKTSKVIINWAAMKSNKLSNISVYSRHFNLSNLQIKWLLNGLKSDKNIDSFSSKTIQNTVNNYIRNSLFFEKLSLDKQNKLNLNFDFQYKIIIASEVLALLINNKFKQITLAQEMDYYNENKNIFIRDEHYDISGIAFKFKDANKIKVFDKGLKILNHIYDNSLSFSQAANEYSLYKNKYTDGNIGKFNQKQLPNIFGINALKQIKTMKPGDISHLVVTDSNLLWIFRLNNIEKPRTMTFEEAQNSINNILGNIQTKQLEYEIVEAILAKYALF